MLMSGKIVKLPTTLDREPLVDAVFEVRMGGAPHLADLLPGALFHQTAAKPTLQRLPAAEIPQPIRDQDPNLAFAPVIRLEWERFTISLGDRNLIISCKLPYPKWPAFKQFIMDIVGKVAQVGIVGPVERYSIKYVNLIEAATVASQIDKINMELRVGNIKVLEDHISVVVHRNEHDTIHIISIMSNAHIIRSDGETISGVVVAVDSIREKKHFADFRVFSEQVGPQIESLRHENKVKFFSSLTEATINEMGPKYD